MVYHRHTVSLRPYNEGRSHPYIILPPLGLFLWLSLWQFPPEEYQTKTMVLLIKRCSALQFYSVLCSHHFRLSLSNDQSSYNLSASIWSLTRLTTTDFANSSKRFFRKAWRCTSNFLPVVSVSPVFHRLEANFNRPVGLKIFNWFQLWGAQHTRIQVVGKCHVRYPCKRIK